MTSITLQHVTTSQAAGDITAALHDFAVASRQLISALWANLTLRSAPAALTRHEEADNLRTIANGLAESDPHFAQDLYAAADRHELGENAD